LPPRPPTPPRPRLPATARSSSTTRPPPRSTTPFSGATAHYYELDENGEIPGPTITFDCKGGDGEDTLTMLSYDLDAFLVNDPFAGKNYTFRYASGGVFLDLYEG
jgi:hypothetical protein